MRDSRVNKILYDRSIAVADLAARVERRLRRRCHREQVSMVINGRRFTPWLQRAIARVLGYRGRDLFGDWWFKQRSAKRRA